MNKILAAALVGLIAAPAWTMGRRPKTSGGTMQPAKDAIADELKPNEWRAAFSGVKEPSARLVTSSGEWQKLWKEALNQPAPAVDFSRYLAAAVFLGVKPTGGHAVEFLEPLSDGKELLLRYRVHAPAPTSFVIQAFTQPYAIKLYRKQELTPSLAEVKQ